MGVAGTPQQLKPITVVPGIVSPQNSLLVLVFISVQYLQNETLHQA